MVGPTASQSWWQAAVISPTTPKKAVSEIRLKKWIFKGEIIKETAEIYGNTGRTHSRVRDGLLGSSAPQRPSFFFAEKMSFKKNIFSPGKAPKGPAQRAFPEENIS